MCVKKCVAFLLFGVSNKLLLLFYISECPRGMTNTVQTFNSCTKCEGILAENTTVYPVATQFSGSGHGYMHDLTTEHSFDYMLRGSFMCLAYFLTYCP